MQKSILNYMECQKGGSVHTKVKVKVTKRSNTTFLRLESTGRNLLKFDGMIGHEPRNNRIVFGSDWIKGQGN